MTIDKSLARKISGAYQSTYSQLVRFFRNRLDNSNDADDLSQDVFTLWLNRKEQTPVKESRAYLFKIANHVLIDHWRRNQRQTKSETSIDDVTHEPHFEQSQADPSEILEHQQRIQRLSEALETLPPVDEKHFCCIVLMAYLKARLLSEWKFQSVWWKNILRRRLFTVKNTLIIRAIIRNDTRLFANIR